MDYKYIQNDKLRRLMETGRNRRKGIEDVSTENKIIKKKMENVLPIKNKSIRKKQKSKISTLKTYVELRI